MAELLDEKVICKRGGYWRVRRWFRGQHPELHGLIIRGVTGWETLVEVEVLKPLMQFLVVARTDLNNLPQGHSST